MATWLAAAGFSGFGTAGLPSMTIQSECAPTNHSILARKRSNPSDSDYEEPQTVSKRTKTSEVNSTSPGNCKSSANGHSNGKKC